MLLNMQPYLDKLYLCVSTIQNRDTDIHKTLHNLWIFASFLWQLDSKHNIFCLFNDYKAKFHTAFNSEYQGVCNEGYLYNYLYNIYL